MKILDFKKEETFVPHTKEEKLFISAIAAIKDETEAANFMRDLMTTAEIEEFSNRLEIARLLMEGNSYLKVAEKAKTSTTTVTRVSHWLFRGCGGYFTILKRLLG